MRLFAIAHGRWVYTGPNPLRWWRTLNEAIKLVPYIHANSSLCLSIVEAIRKELSAMTQEVQALQNSTAALTDAVGAVAEAIHAGIDEIQQLISKVQESINSGTAELPKVKEAADEIMRHSLALRDAADALNAAKAASDLAFPDTPAGQSEGTEAASVVEGEQPPAEDAPAS